MRKYSLPSSLTKPNTHISPEAIINPSPFCPISWQVSASRFCVQQHSGKAGGAAQVSGTEKIYHGGSRHHGNRGTAECMVPPGWPDRFEHLSGWQTALQHRGRYNRQKKRPLRVWGYRILKDGENVGGLVLKVEGDHGDLELLFVTPKAHSKGIGYRAWCAVEQLYPQVNVWETCTPYFEKRNIHFYVNSCGFHIVEFFNEKHPDPVYGG